MPRQENENESSEKERQQRLMREVMPGCVAWAGPWRAMDAIVLGMQENGHKWRHPVQTPIGGWPSETDLPDSL